MPQSILWLYLSLALVLVTVVLWDRKTRNRLPPGPSGLPIIGNTLQMPKTARHLKLTEWAKRYGEIYHFKVGMQSVVVLNSPEAADELLVKRAKNYSERPYAHVASELLSDGQRMLLMPYDEPWKAARKGITSAIGPAKMKHIRKLLELESRVLIKDLLDYGDFAERSPYVAPHTSTHHVPKDHWFFLVRRFVTSTISTITYAQRIHTLHDNGNITKIYDILTNFLNIMQFGRYAVDVFPFLRFLPNCLAKWRGEAKSLHQWEMDLFGGLLDQHKTNTNENTYRDCFISSYLRLRAEGGHADAPGKGITSDGWMRDKFLAYTAGSILEASSDTTSSTLQSWVLYMLANPDAWLKVKEEVDRVVGVERMPAWEDEERLPYLVASIKETMRIRPNGNFGIPHATLQDDEYKGYFIPKGTTVMGNIWAMNRDPERYPDPRIFHPERFYSPGEPTRWGSGPESKGRDFYNFGWGRRFCQGIHVAEAALFIACARIAWALDITPLVDAQTGRAVVPDVDDEEQTWTVESLVSPKVFPAVWKAHDIEKVKVIDAAFEEAQTEWDSLGLDADDR